MVCNETSDFSSLAEVGLATATVVAAYIYISYQYVWTSCQYIYISYYGVYIHIDICT